MLGFMRRYDHSYQVAKKKMENGDIGDVILSSLLFAGPDLHHRGYARVRTALRRSVHRHVHSRLRPDSLADRLRGQGAVGNRRLLRVQTIQGLDDGDNVSGLMKMENDAMAFFFAGPRSRHGSHVETEIVGTRGTLRIASVPTDSLVEVMSQHGVCRECYQDFITRWHDAYITEIEEFCDCVATGRKATQALSTAPVHQDRLPLQGNPS